MIDRLLHTIVAHPAVYDLLQRLCGSERSLDKVRTLAAGVGDGRVLDVGAGTANGLRALPPEAEYVWLDTDRQKLGGLQRHGHHLHAILASATSIPLRAKSVDVGLCLAMSHHLDEAEIPKLFSELARVCRDRLIFIDPVLSNAFVSRLLWKYDRGSFPRTTARLRALVEQRFTIEHEEEYVIYHRYWLCTARPK
jgi:SAM-dependent methyltransferase